MERQKVEVKIRQVIPPDREISCTFFIPAVQVEQWNRASNMCEKLKVEVKFRQGFPPDKENTRTPELTVVDLMARSAELFQFQCLALLFLVGCNYGCDVLN